MKKIYGIAYGEDHKREFIDDIRTFKQAEKQAYKLKEQGQVKIFIDEYEVVDEDQNLINCWYFLDDGTLHKQK